MWLLVLVKLVTPPLVVWPWALPSIWQQDAVESSLVATTSPAPSTAASAQGEEVSAADPLILHSELLIVPLEDEAAERGGRQAIRVATTAAPPSPASSLLAWLATYWTALVIGIWLAGAVAIGLLQALRIRRIARCLAQADDPPEWLACRVRRLAKRMKTRLPQIAVVAGAGSPLVCALGRSKLIWPAALLDEAAIPDWQGVIVHELAHLRRRDHWVGWLELFAACLWWWNPVFWYVRYQLRENAELACDAWVVGILPGGRRAYAEALVSVCDKVSQAAQPMPALGFGRGARRAFERRLKMVLRESVPFRLPRLALASILVLGLLALPSWSQVAGNSNNGGSDENTSAPRSREKSILDDEDESSIAGDKSSTPFAYSYSIAGFGDEIPLALEGAGNDNFSFYLGFVRDWIAAPQEARASRPMPDTLAAGEETRALNHRDLLKELEKKIQRLAAEIDELTVTKKDVEAALEARGFDTPTPSPARRVAETYYQLIDGNKRVPAIRYTQVDSDVASTLILSRTTYRLPEAKAEELKAFIDAQFAIQIDVGVAGDTIVITTTPQQQEVIGKFIALMQGRYSNRAPTQNIAPPAGAAGYPKPEGGRNIPGGARYPESPQGLPGPPHLPGVVPSQKAPKATPAQPSPGIPGYSSPVEEPALKSSRTVPEKPVEVEAGDSSEARPTTAQPKPARPDLGDGDRIVSPPTPIR